MNRFGRFLGAALVVVIVSKAGVAIAFHGNDNHAVQTHQIANNS